MVNRSDPSEKSIHTGLRRMAGVLCILLLWGVMMTANLPVVWCHPYLPEETIQTVDWENLLKELGYSMETAYASDPEPAKQLNLYARAAALIDADTGRLLYGKDAFTEYPMASTTKIMTCLVALENGNPEDIVTVSSHAASQPEVRLGIRKGETYRLIDLLYATMLTSYNDCAVAIAEHIGGSVEGFAAMMNQKAQELGCYQTWYITPNGLDAQNEGGVHRTTAVDLARVLAYAIKNEDFLTITQTQSHSFADAKGKRNFTAVNKNAFLSMMDGVLSGKTGFTNGAGYCYTAALTQNGETYVAAVLGSGWPPHKNYKWSDTGTLMNYGLEQFSLKKIGENDLVTTVVLPVKNGICSGARISLEWYEKVCVMAPWENIYAKICVPECLDAPVHAGSVIGGLYLYLENDPVLFIPAVVRESVDAISFPYCFWQIFYGFFDISHKV